MRAKGDGHLQLRVSQRRGALAPICIGFLLLCGRATAGSYGVTLSASGGAGDACSPPYSIAEQFSQPLESSGIGLEYAGSAVGYDNGYVAGPGQTGCPYSPVFASSGVNASAALGSLTATATAGMTGMAVTPPSASVTDTWDDIFTATSGGNYLLTFTISDSTTASQSCASNGGSWQAQVSYYAIVTNLGPPSQQVAEASWNDTDCAPNAGPAIGSGTVVSSTTNTVQFEISEAAGATFSVNAQLMAQAGMRQTVGLPDSVVANANAGPFGITGLNGATWSDASNTVYSPEPGSWLLAVCGLAALALLGRRGLASK